MIDTRIIDKDEDTGLLTIMHYDEDEDSMTIEHKLDVEPLMEQNLRARNDANSNWKGELHHVAAIDPVTHMKLIASGCIRDKACMKRWLNDSDNEKHRTKKGRV